MNFLLNIGKFNLGKKVRGKIFNKERVRWVVVGDREEKRVEERTRRKREGESEKDEEEEDDDGTKPDSSIKLVDDTFLHEEFRLDVEPYPRMRTKFFLRLFLVVVPTRT